MVAWMRHQTTGSCMRIARAVLEACSTGLWQNDPLNCPVHTCRRHVNKACNSYGSDVNAYLEVGLECYCLHCTQRQSLHTGVSTSNSYLVNDDDTAAVLYVNYESGALHLQLLAGHKPRQQAQTELH